MASTLSAVHCSVSEMFGCTQQRRFAPALRWGQLRQQRQQGNGRQPEQLYARPPHHGERQRGGHQGEDERKAVHAGEGRQAHRNAHVDAGIARAPARRSRASRASLPPPPRAPPPRARPTSAASACRPARRRRPCGSPWPRRTAGTRPSPPLRPTRRGRRARTESSSRRRTSRPRRRSSPTGSGAASASRAPWPPATGPAPPAPTRRMENLGNVSMSSAAEASARTQFSTTPAARHPHQTVAHQVRHIGTAHQRSAEHRLEAEGQAVLAVLFELPRFHVFRDRKVAARGLQILSDGGDVSSRRAQIAQQRAHFVRRFAQSHHEAGFRQHVRRVTYGRTPGRPATAGSRPADARASRGAARSPYCD